ncbi:acyl-CoA N-acyltransferase [Kockovaella imperatae]|uniref:Acyl-CoA N-acyltransferase n=1 Tax=Kockovaella imperatae TaxID=4999 RepID=A0A1Y1U9I5_9TREE|nr:acyl-CoA N-acyltransferase [Kockovaella imperatae]ORX34167.1 acyl-CoA N-acyltransferase [Kockovaella imperatae]
MTQYTISKGTKEDVAVYEKEPDAVVTNHDQLVENIFNKGYANIFVARVKTEDGSRGEAVGFALYFFTFSTWLGVPGLYLEDLYVKPDHRANGLGKRLFGELGAVAKERGCGRVEWRVLKWNQPSIDFYVKRLKAESLDEWDTMRLEGSEAIARLVQMRQQ